MFCLGRPQGEDVYCINNQDTLLFSLLPVPCIELAEGDSCAALGSYSPGHVTVAPESLSLCRQRLASSSWSATLAMATGKVKSDRYGSRRLRAAGRAVAFQREWKGFFSSVQLGTGHQPAALLAQGTLDGPQPHSQSGGSVCGSGIRHPWLAFLLRNTLITPTPQSLTPKAAGWEG